MKRSILSFLLLGLLLAATVVAQPTIFIVRHAEKNPGPGKDPDLSDAGRARAELLARVLRDAGLTAIYVTEFKRTQQTAAPLAKALGIEAEKMAARDATSLAAKLRGLAQGRALVVGHSNTIPDLIKALGLVDSIEMAESDYDNLFVIILDEKPRLIRLHY